jgi:hypothetical protein
MDFSDKVILQGWLLFLKTDALEIYLQKHLSSKTKLLRNLSEKFIDFPQT